MNVPTNEISEAAQAVVRQPEVSLFRRSLLPAAWHYLPVHRIDEPRRAPGKFWGRLRGRVGGHDDANRLLRGVMLVFVVRTFNKLPILISAEVWVAPRTLSVASGR